MSVCAIVPFRSFSGGKQRLAGVLDEAGRLELNRVLLKHVLEVVRDSPSIERSLVVSPDRTALELVHELGSEGLVEQGKPDLNSALRQAARAAQSGGARALLIIAADLPDLCVADIEALIAQDPGESATVVLAPDRHGRGTNLLYLRPPDAIPFCFGTDSFVEHTRAASQRGLIVAYYRSHGASFDVDQPADLELYRRANRPDRIAES